MTAAGVVFERHVQSAALFPPEPTTSPPMNDPCTNAVKTNTPGLIELALTGDLLLIQRAYTVQISGRAFISAYA